MMQKGFLQRYFLNTIYWKTHQRVYEWILPLIWIHWNFLTWNKKQKMIDAIHTVEEVMFKVTEHLDREKQKYLSGNTFSAADLTFAAHASLILWPNKHEDYLDKLKVHVPHLEAVKNLILVNFVRRWKETLAGKHAIRICRIHRGTNFGQRPSRYDQRHNPWWTFGKLSLYLPWLILAMSLCIGLFPIWGAKFMKLKTLLMINGTVLLGLALMFLGFRYIYRERYEECKGWLSMYKRHNFGRHV